MTRLPASLAVLALVAAGCGSSSSSDSSSSKPSKPAKPAAGAAGARVVMKDIQFAPKATSVKVGQKVTWTNKDQVDHNVTASAGASFHSQDFGSGGTYSFTPKKAGTIKYACTIHPGMDGTLKVTG